MKKKLLEAKKNVSLKQVGQSLSQNDLMFITGGTSIVGGAGTSSTSGTNCCDATCLCKQNAQSTISE